MVVVAEAREVEVAAEEVVEECVVWVKAAEESVAEVLLQIVEGRTSWTESR